MATNHTSASNGPAAGGVATGIIRHANDKGMEEALGIGRNGKRLNTHAGDVQMRIEDARDDYLEVVTVYLNLERHDMMKNGMLGEVVSRTPILVYDLPELKRKVDTAFVDRTGRMYIADTFAQRLLEEHEAGLESLNFIFGHEAEHLRRLHLSRMADFPHEIANAAQDIRINIDLVRGIAAERASAKLGRDATAPELEQYAEAFYTEHANAAISIGWAMKIEDYRKYVGLSEEAIAALLMKDWKDAPAMPNREVSFEHIMEGAAQDTDSVKTLIVSGAKLPPAPPAGAMTPADLSGLAQDLRHIGKVKANAQKVSDATLQAVSQLLEKLQGHQGLLQLDLQHAKAVTALAGTGATHTSAKTGDAYIDGLKPSDRVELARQCLAMILNPSAGSGMKDPRKGGLTLKDLDRALRGQPSDGADRPANGGGASQDIDATTVPSPNVLHSHDHVMGTEDLVDTLKDAGIAPDVLQKLGLDDLRTAQAEAVAAKDNVVSAINKATEDMMKVGSRYPGGHLVNYASAQMRDFYKPVLTWEMALKKMTEAVGKGQRHAPDEPWMIYHVDAADMGFKHQRDVPYMGSNVPGKEVKPLVIDIIDTSGSVDDAMLKRFVSEALNQARKMSRATAPDVLISFADTIARGDPVFITEKNYKKYLDKGIDYGGRGGTNFQASIENVFELVKPGAKSGLAKRPIDAIVYMTDTGDQVPDPRRLLAKAQACGLKKLPPILFLAPKSCFNQAFNDEVKKWAGIVWFDSKQAKSKATHVDLTAEARDQERKQRSISPARP